MIGTGVSDVKSRARPLCKTLLTILLVIAAALIALGMHAALPAKVDEALLDGSLVKQYGFVAVAAAYFVILFAHSAVVLILNRRSLLRPRLGAALFFGLSFALIYMIGMQEIVFSASPYEKWGTDYFLYQLLMGIGDAVPALLLSLVVGILFFRDMHNTVITMDRATTLGVLLFVVIVGTVRLLAYFSGAITNELSAYPLPVTAWSYLLGLIFGIVYLLISRTTIAKARTMLLGVGINWMIFNVFMGLVQKGTMADSLLRGAIDMVAIAIAMGLSAVVGRSRLGRSAAAFSGPMPTPKH
ncbi:MAG: hypothetical protein JXA87_09945 [Thermoleophilia bacterium]|nr:hypothetical protein [Thermoleophilia bacterium]